VIETILQTLGGFRSALGLGHEFVKWIRRGHNPEDRSRPRLIFVERPLLSGWNTTDAGGKPIISLQTLLTATNTSDRDGTLITRAQIRRGGLFNLYTTQECPFCDVAGERVGLLSPGVLIPPRTTAVVRITHPFETAKSPRRRGRLAFVVTLIDQFNIRHRRRVSLKYNGR
jgi:hypothetical protein